jgi:hypothetical protein
MLDAHPTRHLTLMEARGERLSSFAKQASLDALTAPINGESNLFAAERTQTPEEGKMTMTTLRQPKQLTATNRPRGVNLLDRPTLNKGTAFTEEERSRLGLHGLLPPQVESLDQQAARAYEAYRRKDDDLERHIYLRALQDTNEVLFYRLLLDHIEEMTPMVYTPVVAQACQQFSHIYRRPRGLFVSYPLRESIPALPSFTSTGPTT